MISKFCFSIRAILAIIICATFFIAAQAVKEEGVVVDMGQAAVSTQEFVQGAIRSAKVVIFAKSYCPYCVRVKELFKRINVQFQTFDLDQMGAEDCFIYSELL